MTQPCLDHKKQDAYEALLITAHTEALHWNTFQSSITYFYPETWRVNVSINFRRDLQLYTDACTQKRLTVEWMKILLSSIY